MRRLIVLIVAVPLVFPGAALAQETPSPSPRSLAELAAAVQQEIDFFTGVPSASLPASDQDAYRNYHLARVDLFIGSIRQEAHATLASEITDAALAAAIWELDGAATPNDVATALAAKPFPTDDEERFALDWVGLYVAVDRLRSVTAGERPVRVCPVAGTTWFVDDFSEPRPWGRSHTGIDLNGEFGTPLQAIEAGTVVQANWHWAGGRQVWIRADATGDVYYYAHLESWARWIWTGTRVEAGDVIGTLGWSGDADAAHLHFGWMPGSSDVDLDNLQDAYPLLLEICR